MKLFSFHWLLANEQRSSMERKYHELHQAMQELEKAKASALLAVFQRPEPVQVCLSVWMSWGLLTFETAELEEKEAELAIANQRAKEYELVEAQLHSKNEDLQEQIKNLDHEQLIMTQVTIPVAFDC